QRNRYRFECLTAGSTTPFRLSPSCSFSRNTRGVDLGARREIYEEIRRLAANGLGILLVSSDAEEVAGLADRAIVFEEGRAVAALGANASAAELMQAAESHSVSAANELEKA
ncbi:hypothetical protein ACCS78_24825, partial [Rhizobium johnstonii]